jgi:hypothetical protein
MPSGHATLVIRSMRASVFGAISKNKRGLQKAAAGGSTRVHDWLIAHATWVAQPARGVWEWSIAIPGMAVTGATTS